MNKRICAAALMGLGMLSASARATVIYDGSLNTEPGAQGWTQFFVGGTHSAAGGIESVNTLSSESVQGGFSRSSTPIDSTTGMTLSFNVKLLSETHNGSSNRAGLSVIFLDSNKKGIEIGFWADEVWSQDDSPLFVRGEVNHSFDTTAAYVNYALTLHNGSYELSANGASILSGLMRDYSAFAGFPDPYETPNFIFLGDDTTSAAASWQLTQVSLSAIPEPTAGLMLLLGVGAAMMRRR
ncbi:MAG: PEP-CTERM sorting domain-containing protein [Planctomycetes bacterium]|nr:PEP-CTERM sorting domain-containing protein [Planctomycetota bacterium]